MKNALFAEETTYFLLHYFKKQISEQVSEQLPNYSLFLNRTPELLRTYIALKGHLLCIIKKFDKNSQIYCS